MLHHVGGRIARSLRGALRRAGLHVERFPPRNDPFTLVSRIISDLGVEFVIDVGANRGQWASQLRRYGYHGRILSLEPDGRAYAQLAASAASEPGWEVMRAAVGSRPGRVRLNAAGDSAVSSLLTPTTAYLERNPDGATVRSEEVELVRIDELAPIVTSSGPLFLKTDTQGWDLEVLRGLDGVQPRVVGIQVELSVRAIYEGSTSHREVIEYLEESGFVPAGFFTVDRDRRHRLVEYDGVFVRDL